MLSNIVIIGERCGFNVTIPEFCMYDGDRAGSLNAHRSKDCTATVTQFSTGFNDMVGKKT